ncbi:hypothetical protein LCGC14_2771160, partial [marine sediment metagenome]
MSIVELPGNTSVSRVGIDGRISFPRLGSFQAGGQDIEALQEEMNLATAGNVLSVFSPVGERYEVVLDGSSIFLEIVAYRPVYMTGDVSQRGPVQYVPGLTVRTALASAGGASEVPVMFETAVMAAPRLRAEYRVLALEHAKAVVDLWEIDAILSGNPDLERPDPSTVAIDADAFS